MPAFGRDDDRGEANRSASSWGGRQSVVVSRLFRTSRLWSRDFGKALQPVS